MSTADQTYFWAQLIMDELFRLGVRHICLSPGSRSTPLTTAAARHDGLDTTLHIDERAAAYYAQGYARATGRPAPLICTSGTAAANYLPAVIEASQDHVPMILLTADRPPELRQTEANQTIDQVKLFGPYVRWQVDLPCASEAIAPEMVLSTVDQAMHRAMGSPPGPAHLNCQIRKPFLPETLPDRVAYQWPSPQSPLTSWNPIVQQPDPAGIEDAGQLIALAQRGLVLVGSLRSGRERQCVMNLIDALHWPALPDVRSGLRLGVDHPCLISNYELLLQSPEFREICCPDIVLTIGGRFVSNRLTDLLRESGARLLRLQAHPERDDPAHLGGRILEGAIDQTCQALQAALAKQGATEWLMDLREWQEKATRSFPAGWHEPQASRLLSQCLPSNHGLYLGASLPIRDFHTFAVQTGGGVMVAANRGASGIDGTLASAIGFARGLGRPVTLVLGDLAALHDLNSLALLRESPVPVSVIIFNNRGGGIFNLLPVANQESVFSPYFTTPHTLDFSAAASMFDLPYTRVEGADELKDAYLASLRQGKSVVIEVPTGQEDYGMVTRTWLEALANA